MRRYEVWTPGGCVGAWTDIGIARRAFDRERAPALLTLGASVLALRQGTTPKQRDEIEALAAAKHKGVSGVEMPTPEPDAPRVYRMPVIARLGADTVDDDTTDDDAPIVALKTCAARGCGEIAPAVRPKSNDTSWRAAYCPRHRDTGRKAIEEGRATVKTVGAYLDARGGAPAFAVTATSITVPLPPDLARAAACADRMGGIDELERLVNAAAARRR